MKDRLEEIIDNSDYEEGKYLVPQDYFVWLIETVERQHFELLALEANLKGNDKITEEQQKEIDDLTLDKDYLLTENKRYQKAVQEFEKEFEYECGWQIQNAQGKSQWHKGALEGFNHVKRMFNKQFK